MAKAQAFTPSTVDNLKSGKISDPTRPGLSIEATAKGKVWRYYRRIAGSGTPVKMTLGLFPAHTIAAARHWADDLNLAVEAGQDPRAAMRETKALEAMTLVGFGCNECHGVGRPTSRQDVS